MLVPDPIERRSELCVRTTVHLDGPTRQGSLLTISSPCRSAVLVPGVLCCAPLLFSVLCFAPSPASPPRIEGVEFDARNQEGTILVKAAARLRAGQVLVLDNKGLWGEAARISTDAAGGIRN